VSVASRCTVYTTQLVVSSDVSHHVVGSVGPVDCLVLYRERHKGICALMRWATEAAAAAAGIYSRSRSHDRYSRSGFRSSHCMSHIDRPTDSAVSCSLRRRLQAHLYSLNCRRA